MRLGLADPPQAITQTVENVVEGPLRGHLLWRAFRLNQELLTHRFGRDPREGQRSLEFRVRLACRLYDGLDLLYQGRLLLFGFVPTAIRKIVQTTNARAQLVQPCLDLTRNLDEQALAAARTVVLGLRHAKGEQRVHEALLSAVMEVALDPVTLLVLGGNDP